MPNNKILDKKVAIITSCYNTSPELLHKHFWSIQKQIEMHSSILHIIVDDASTDIETRAALLYAADINKDYTVLIGKTENSGPGAARNRAIDLIRQIGTIQYICLLDSDDYFEPGALQFRMKELEYDKNIIAVYGDKYTAKWDYRVDSIDNKKWLTEIKKTLEAVPQFNRKRLMQECYIPSCSVMWRAKPFLERVGYFHEGVRLCEDWLVWRKLSMLGEFKKLNFPIYTQTLHGKNLTTNKSVLNNHLMDMIVTGNDLENWIAQNAEAIKYE